MICLCRGFAAKNLLFIYLFIYLFGVQDGREEERERNINVWLPLICPLLGTWTTTQGCALTGNQTGNPLVHGLALSPLSYTNQSKNLDTIKISLSKKDFFCTSTFGV